MNLDTVVREYYRILVNHELPPLMTLFSADAVVDHPIFGEMPATEFFEVLLDRAKSHEITILNVFQAMENSNRLAAYLKAKFVTKDNTHFDEKSIHIFDILNTGLIQRLTVIIDTYPFRGEYASGT